MPALPPAEFVAKATEQGFTFSVKPDGKLGVKPPASGMTHGVRRYVSAMKTELLALLTKGPAESPVTQPGQQEAQIIDPAPVTSSATVTGSAPVIAPVAEPAPLESVLYPDGDGRGVLLAWALSECIAGRFPEPVEPIKLFNGETTGESASDWLLAAFRRAKCLSPDSSEFLHLRQSMKEVAIWGADCVRWERLTVTHQGAASPWPAESEGSE